MSAAGAIVILGLGGFLISKFFPHLGALGPWLGATLSVIAVGLANRWRFKSNRWKKIDLFKQRPAVVAVKSEAAVE
jgi:Na+-driven multidrug efflux pump